jgi:hypothetical protein
MLWLGLKHFLKSRVMMGESAGEEETSETQPEETALTETEETTTEETSEVESKEEIQAPPATIDIQTKEEINSLRILVREQASALKRLQGQSTKVATALTESGHIDESVLEDASVTEEGAVSNDRAELLSVLAETMRLNPAYSNFEEVCSQENFDMTVDALAKLAVQEEGGTLTDKIAEVTKYIWGLPNPYKFVYDVVTTHHPKYATSSHSATPAREKPKAPTSVSSIPGGSGGKNSGWTAAKIDALPESELGTVPPNIYDLYMKNELE